MSCDIHNHTPARKSSTNFQLYYFVIQICSTNWLGHGHGYEWHSLLMLLHYRLPPRVAPAWEAPAFLLGFFFVSCVGLLITISIIIITYYALILAFLFILGCPGLLICLASSSFLFAGRNPRASHASESESRQSRQSSEREVGLLICLVSCFAVLCCFSLSYLMC